MKVTLEIRLLKDKTDKQGQPIAWPAPGVKLFDGDLVQFRVHNPNPFPVDVTLLYIDSDCGIILSLPTRSGRSQPRGSEDADAAHHLHAQHEGAWHWSTWS